MPDENDITEEHPPVADDTQAHEPVAVPPPPPAGPPGRRAGPPPPQVPPRLYADAWPWLALLGILAVAGLLVWLFALRGNDKGTIVPGVVGMQQQQAIAKLTGDGFGVRAIIGPSQRPRGIVFSQKPGGGSRLDKGQNVVINVSNGLGGKTPTPTTSTQQTTTQQQTTTATTTATTTTAAQRATVPDVSGQAAADGAGQVEAAGFVAETQPVAEAGTAGSVVAQDPGGGQQADAGSIVQLSIATGSNRTAKQVPDVVGQKAAAARAAILDAQLTVKTEYKKGPAKSAGTVLSQSPSAGASQPAWSQVAIVVGS